MTRVVALLLATAAFTSVEEPTEHPKMQLWVPAYYYPFGKGLDEWNRLIASVKKAPIVAIVNPNSGPGERPDTNYLAVIGRARNAGVTVVGYVGTQYTKRPLAEVKAEVDRWVQFYPKLQGIHVDEQSSEADKVDYYAELYEYIRKRIPDAKVLTNPGTNCAAEYVSRPASDVVCLFERDKGFDVFQPPAWAGDYPARRFAAQAYAVETSQKMEAYVQESSRRRIGYVYFTDAKGANPYDRLPSYWDVEVAAVRRVNQSKQH